MQLSLTTPVHRTIVGSVLAVGGLVLGAIALTPQSAQAALLSRGLTAPSDGLLTRDTSTGLDWLDITETSGRSYEEVRDGFGGYTTQQGFRFATTADVSALFSSALVGKSSVLISTTNTLIDLPQTYSAAREINTLLGTTFRFFTTTSRGSIDDLRTEGYVLNPDASEPARLVGVNSSRSLARVSGVVPPGGGTFSSEIGRGVLEIPLSSPFPFRPGSFLVRSSSYGVSTPEPSVLLGSLAIVLGGLWRGRSKQAAI
jgi:hypothetical protein